MRAMRSRIRRYDWRRETRKKSIAIAISGISDQRHERELDVQVDSRTATMPSSVRPSIAIVSAPAANISFMTSTSVVMRVTSRPTGLRSK